MHFTHYWFIRATTTRHTAPRFLLFARSPPVPVSSGISPLFFFLASHLPAPPFRVPFRYVRTSFHCRDYYRSPFLSIELAVTPTSDVNAAGRSTDSRTTPLRSGAPTRTSYRYLTDDATEPIVLGTSRREYSPPVKFFRAFDRRPTSLPNNRGFRLDRNSPSTVAFSDYCN